MGVAGLERFPTSFQGFRYYLIPQDPYSEVKKETLGANGAQREREVERKVDERVRE